MSGERKTGLKEYYERELQRCNELGMTNEARDWVNRLIYLEELEVDE